MRIALFTEVYLPYINGVVTHVKLLREGLEKLGHTVLVVTSDPNTHHHYIEDGVLHCPAVKLKKLYGYGLASPYSSTRTQMLEKFGPDIIHIHTEFSMGISGIHIAHKLKVPLVYTLHTMYDDYVYYVAPRHLAKLAREVSRQYAGHFARNAQALTSPSEKGSIYFKEVGITKPVNIIPNAVELDRFMVKNIDPAAIAAVREKYGLNDGRMVACFVGRLGKEKSVDVLLDDWAEAICPEDGIRLMVVGDGPVREELEAQAKNLGLGDQVIFTGMIPHDDLPPYLAVCDVYVTASLSDTNSISMLEGEAAGLPVLQRFDPINADQVIDGDNGYMYTSAEDLGRKLRLIRDLPPEKLAALRARTTQFVKNSGAEDLANYTLSVYHTVYKNRQRTQTVRPLLPVIPFQNPFK